MPTTSTDLIVNRADFSDARFVETALPDPGRLGPGQALLKVDEFALTANNITYAVVGDAFGYWDFFPAEKGWGRVPVWGFADVIASTAAGVAAGERLYGYLPMSTHLLIEPGAVNERSLMDVAAHRRERAPIYNQYTRCGADPTYRREHEALISLFRPLFATSFLLDDLHAENAFFGARSVILSSASSKTAIGLAHLLSARADQVSVIGLTGKQNLTFVQALGCYDQVVTYDELESLPAAPAAFVDMAGNAEVLARLHRHLQQDLRSSLLVGATHHEARGRSGDGLPGPKPQVFFAPGYAQARIKQWGGAGFQARLDEAWSGFLPRAQGLCSVKRGRGWDAVLKTYQDVFANRAEPGVGNVLSLWP